MRKASIRTLTLFVLLVVLVVLAVIMGLRRNQSALPAASSTASTTSQTVTGNAAVSGVLIRSSGATQAKVRLGLIEVRLVSMLGKEIQELPPKENVIIDSTLKPVTIVETDPAGRFEFQGVAKGRYSIAVESQLHSRGIEPPWLRSGGNAVVFDVGANGRVDIGKVNPPNEP